jgi:hypothetical protein
MLRLPGAIPAAGSPKVASRSDARQSRAADQLGRSLPDVFRPDSVTTVRRPESKVTTTVPNLRPMRRERTNRASLRQA